jgi:hypothetical protein
MSIKKDCIHFDICDADSCLDCKNSKCDSYEPKRVKCEDCIVGLWVDSLILESNKHEVELELKFTYFPKCGTKIEVKE